MRLMRDLVGSTLNDRYRLVARIAGGGMGEVYRGHDLLLDRAVAVKVLQPALAADPELVDRFRLEARAAARLTHPNVVGVYDWGAEDDLTYYMVMEYVPGTDLRDVLVTRGCLEPAQAAEIVAALCDALHAAHSEGLVHRDVKPENVLLARNGKVKVADFGIAVIVDADRTVPGGIPGTLRYLSPEQARGEEATASSDTWAAGAVLAESLTGRPPLHGTGGDLLRRRAEEQPTPPSALDHRLPSELDDIVMKACALEPEERYANAAEMAHALRHAIAFSLPEAPHVTALLEDVTGEISLVGGEPTTHIDRSARRYRRRRALMRRLKRTVVGVGVVALLGFGAVKGAPFLFGPAMVDVPDVLRLTKADATERLQELGFEVDLVTRRDKFEPKGEVLKQEPFSGLLEEGSTVTLVVSSGPPKKNLPSIEGKTLDDATSILERKGMEVGSTRREWNVEFEKGRVVFYAPDGPRLPWGTVVDLVVSRGARPLEIPDVAGLSLTKASTTLEEAGFVVAGTTTDAFSDDIAAGRIIATEPGATEMAPESSEVTLVVSAGPEFEEIRLPDVRQMSLGAARNELEELGLRVRAVQTCDGGSIVTETDPLSGTIVRENDLIALFVC
jgi:eukaryotic-like serine/threonine-protein kinase